MQEYRMFTDEELKLIKETDKIKNSIEADRFKDLDPSTKVVSDGEQTWFIPVYKSDKIL